jgi:hypothetical protein
MGHAEIDNKTPFAFETLFVSDEEGCPLVAPVVKATFRIGDDRRLSLSEQQVPVNHAGEWWGKPEVSSCKYEPEVAFVKPATDIVLIGSACAQRSTDTEVDVMLCVGPLEKSLHISGDRYWVKMFAMPFISPAERFEKIPLVYERAFGGWDRSNPDPGKHTFEVRNPVGTGFRDRRAKFAEGVRLPNLEDPRERIAGWDDNPPPAGFGFTSPNWQPRASLAGTYDDEWARQRMPLLPKNFDRRFFNSASTGLVYSHDLAGDEPVMIQNVLPDGPIVFNLPRVSPPGCRLEIKGRADVTLQTRLDTVIINTDEKLLFLIWRAHTTLRDGPHDVVSIEVQAEAESSTLRTE